VTADVVRAPLDDRGQAGSPVVVETSLDDLRSDDVRFLQEAARLGPLHVRVPSDDLVAAWTGAPPTFPAVERLFLAESMRWVEHATIVERPVADEMLELADRGASLVLRGESGDPAALRTAQAAARAAGLRCHVVSLTDRAGFPVTDTTPPPPDVSRVVVTGCYDWLHSGHVRFFMDAAAFGALYAVVGSDQNVALLKGPGHPMQREEERRYMVGAVRSVHRCMVSSGSGWMDAEPEIAEIRPTFYVVNEDGDQPEKREFCQTHGIEYVVLARVPHAGLPARSSTELRGF
jgi:cytidyltransferase-like protein